MNSRPNPLSLQRLEDERIAFTREYGAILAQAAGVCLEDQGHAPGATLVVSGAHAGKFALDWPAITEEIRRCWRDLQYATEHGAYGIAALLVVNFTDLQLVERLWKGTGFDFWLGKDDDDLFQNKVRLEVSGVLHGDRAIVDQRVRAKLRQTERSHMNLDVIVVVVEFSEPSSRIAQQ